jgi:hypothetical protein
MSELTASKTEQLETLMQELHGCTFDEFVNRAMLFSFDQGLLEGHRIGRTDGRRKAKGLKNTPKRRGRPSAIDEGVAPLMLHEVSEAQKSGIAVKDAVIDFLKSQEVGKKVLELDDPEIFETAAAAKRIAKAVERELDHPKTRRSAMRFYHRIRRKGRSASSLQSSWDETLRSKIDLLKKQQLRSPS